ncbi:unnamed protein product, partial [Polarella glacialis]
MDPTIVGVRLWRWARLKLHALCNWAPNEHSCFARRFLPCVVNKRNPTQQQVLRPQQQGPRPPRQQVLRPSQQQ